MLETEKTIALLIDADNAEEKKMKSVIMQISAFGRIVVKRAYGNWTKDVLKNWESDFRELAIKPIQQIDYVKGKNATDMALTIDAMDFLYTSKYDTYAIVSSDSDFTPLAIKLREAGKFVIGVGKKTTSEAFIQSCDKFISTEDLETIIDEQNADFQSTEIREDKHNKKNELDELLSLIVSTQEYQDEDGFINLVDAGTYIKRVKPDFNIKSYGSKKLSEYIKQKSNLYEMKKYEGKGGVNIIAYKVK